MVLSVCFGVPLPLYEELEDKLLQLYHWQIRFLKDR